MVTQLYTHIQMYGIYCWRDSVEYVC